MPEDFDHVSYMYQTSVCAVSKASLLSYSMNCHITTSISKSTGHHNNDRNIHTHTNHNLDKIECVFSDKGYWKKLLFSSVVCSPVVRHAPSLSAPHRQRNVRLLVTHRAENGCQWQTRLMFAQTLVSVPFIEVLLLPMTALMSMWALHRGTRMFFLCSFSCLTALCYCKCCYRLLLLLYSFCSFFLVLVSADWGSWVIRSGHWQRSFSP